MQPVGRPAGGFPGGFKRGHVADPRQHGERVLLAQATPLVPGCLGNEAAECRPNVGRWHDQGGPSAGGEQGGGRAQGMTDADDRMTSTRLQKGEFQGMSRGAKVEPRAEWVITLIVLGRARDAEGRTI